MVLSDIGVSGEHKLFSLMKTNLLGCMVQPSKEKHLSAQVNISLEVHCMGIQISQRQNRCMEGGGAQYSVLLDISLNKFIMKG